MSLHQRRNVPSVPSCKVVVAGEDSANPASVAPTPATTVPAMPQSHQRPGAAFCSRPRTAAEPRPPAPGAGRTAPAESPPEPARRSRRHHLGRAPPSAPAVLAPSPSGSASSLSSSPMSALHLGDVRRIGRHDHELLVGRARLAQVSEPALALRDVDQESRQRGGVVTRLVLHQRLRESAPPGSAFRRSRRLAAPPAPPPAWPPPTGPALASVATKSTSSSGARFLIALVSSSPRRRDRWRDLG